jgi:hypothetical protein
VEHRLSQYNGFTRIPNLRKEREDGDTTRRVWYIRIMSCDYILNEAIVGKPGIGSRLKPKSFDVSHCKTYQIGKTCLAGENLFVELITS